MALGNIYYENGTFVETIIADNEQGVFVVECRDGDTVKLYRVHYLTRDGKHEVTKAFYFLQTATAFYRNKSNELQAIADYRCFEQPTSEYEDIS